RGGAASAGKSRSTSTCSGVLIRHPLLELAQGAAEPRRAGGGADAEQPGDRRPVELQQDTQGDDLALAGRELAERALERRGDALGEQRLGHALLLARVDVLAPPPAALGAEVVERYA